MSHPPIPYAKIHIGKTVSTMPQITVDIWDEANQTYVELPNNFVTFSPTPANFSSPPTLIVATSSEQGAMATWITFICIIIFLCLLATAALYRRRKRRQQPRCNVNRQCPNAKSNIGFLPI